MVLNLWDIHFWNGGRENASVWYIANMIIFSEGFLLSNSKAVLIVVTSWGKKDQV